MPAYAPPTTAQHFDRGSLKARVHHLDPNERYATQQKLKTQRQQSISPSGDPLALRMHKTLTNVDELQKFMKGMGSTAPQVLVLHAEAIHHALRPNSELRHQMLAYLKTKGLKDPERELHQMLAKLQQSYTAGSKCLEEARSFSHLSKDIKQSLRGPLDATRLASLSKRAQEILKPKSAIRAELELLMRSHGEEDPAGRIHRELLALDKLAAQSIKDPNSPALNQLSRLLARISSYDQPSLTRQMMARAVKLERHVASSITPILSVAQGFAKSSYNKWKSSTNEQTYKSQTTCTTVLSSRINARAEISNIKPEAASSQTACVIAPTTGLLNKTHFMKIVEEACNETAFQARKLQTHKKHRDEFLPKLLASRVKERIETEKRKLAALDPKLAEGMEDAHFVTLSSLFARLRSFRELAASIFTKKIGLKSENVA